MKYVTFAIMAVLIFGVAAAPVFSNGVAFAQTEKEVTIEQKEAIAAKKEAAAAKKEAAAAKKEAAAAKKEAAAAKKEAIAAKKEAIAAKKEIVAAKKEIVAAKKEKTAAKQEASIEKKQAPKEKYTVAKELQEQRRAALEERKRLLMEKLAEDEKIDRERMQERFDAMKNRSPMTDAINRLNQANSPCGPGTIFDSETNSCVLDLVDSNDASTDTNTDNTQYRDNVGGTNEHQNTTLDKTGTYFDKLRYTISEQKRSQDNLFKQITVLLNLVDSMCEDKVIVAGISDGKLRCIDADKAFNMFSRGLVTLVE